MRSKITNENQYFSQIFSASNQKGKKANAFQKQKREEMITDKGCMNFELKKT